MNAPIKGMKVCRDARLGGCHISSERGDIVAVLPDSANAIAAQFAASGYLMEALSKIEAMAAPVKHPETRGISEADWLRVQLGSVASAARDALTKAQGEA